MFKSEGDSEDGAGDNDVDDNCAAGTVDSRVSFEGGREVYVSIVTCLLLW